MLTPYVIAPVLVAAFLYVTSTNRSARTLAVIFQAALFMASIYLVYITRDGEVVTFIGNYVDGLGITLRANNLSADFVLITAFIFLIVSSFSYRDKKDVPLFWFLMFIMEATLIGLFFSRDLFNVFVLMELSTAVTLILVMYDRNRRNVFHGMVFLMTNLVAAQFYLFGLGYIYMLTGSMDASRIADVIATLPANTLILPYALIMTAIAFKCTLIPFFSWSPKVRVYPGAPTIVQAILSGLQIKSAVYLFLLFQEIFEPIAVNEFFLAIGIISGLFGAFMAICQSNVKMILAYHTVSQVGLIIIGVSVGSAYAYTGGLYHIFSHAVFKTTLFLCVGMIIPIYGTSNIYEIRGVMKRLPMVSIATIAAVLGIVGAPFFIGSVSKYFISYDIPFLLNAVVIVISLGTVVSFVKFSSMFFGKPGDNCSLSRPGKFKAVPTLALGIICLAGGIFGTQIIYFLFRHNVNVVATSYVQKSLIFLVNAGVGFLIYKYLVSGNMTLKRIGEMNLSFRSVCIAIGVFFGVMLLYVGFLYR